MITYTKLMPLGFCLLAILMVKLLIIFARDYTDNWVGIGI